ncbi:hypothetical protein WA026_011193 [Henosepilachna vigintioctopunctata]|uniref:Major facilitator superfamily (MFS) profile domain-containing protein n=1 Tax=Henosepilachna vigintioctopunctata TaxID=420089 RepID=A0AAW1U0N7_9CUCU
MFMKFFAANDKSGFNEYLVAISACIFSFSCGVHQAWTSPYIPKLLQSNEYPFEITNEAASYIAIFGPVGDIVGSLLSMLLVDRLGRKNTLVVLGISILISSILLYFSYLSSVFIYVARFFGGVSSGTLMSIMPVYTSEISRPSIRGKVGTISVFSYTFGAIAVNLLGNYLTIYESALIFGIVNITFLLTFVQMPESPYYLLMKGNIVETEESLSFLRRTKDVKEELTILMEDVKRQLSERGHFKDLFIIDSNRKALFLIILGRIFQQFTGGTAFMMYAQNLLEDSRYIIEPHIAVIILTFIQAWLGLIAGRVSDRFGRIPPMFYSCIVCSLILGLLGIYYVLRDFSDVSVPGSSVFVLVGFHYAAFQTGVGSLIALVMGEIFSTSIKSKAICIANLFLSMTVILTAKFYQISSDYLHISVCFFSFAIITLIGAFFMKFLPETNGKTLEEIQMVLKGEVQKGNKITTKC